MKNLTSRFAALALIAGLSGCGGGAGAPASSVRGGTSAASLTLKLGGGAKANAALRSGKAGVRFPRYVSVATNGLQITAYPSGTTPPTTPTAYVDVSPTSSLCGTPAPDGTRTCTIPFSAPLGNDDILITAVDQPPTSSTAPGKALSTGTLHNFAIVSGQTNNINVALDGIVAKILPQPPALATAADGVSQTLALGVNVQDADGFFIIDTLPYANPLTFAVAGDANKTITVNGPSSSDQTLYSVTYNGGALTDGTITFSAQGATSGATDVTPLVVAPSSLTLTHGTGTATLVGQQALYPAVSDGGHAGAIFASSTNPSSCVTVTNPNQTPGPPGAAYSFSISAAVATGATTCAVLVTGLNNVVFSVPVTIL